MGKKVFENLNIDFRVNYADEIFNSTLELINNINYDKKKIAEIYTALGIRELNIFTRSCESLEDIGVEHCGNCWWCKEREWAFD